MNVPLLNLKSQYFSIKDEIDSSIKKILDSQVFVLGKAVEKLEIELAEYCQAEHAIGCASGTDALLMALMALDIGPGDEVITTPFSFYASASSITRSGATPRFADIDPETFCIDPKSIESLITSKTKAILPVHIFGHMAEMDEINAIAAKHNLFIIEDACQAIGSSYKGKRAGSFGHIACFSFYPTKNLGAFGDAGLVTTDNKDIADRIKILRNHGEKEKYVHYEVGINSRLDAFQAAILSAKLPHLEEWNRKRRLNANFYDTSLKEVERIITPIRKDEDIGSSHTFHQYSILSESRDELSAFLKEKGIGNSVFYPVVLYLQPCFKYLGNKEGLCPVAEKTAASVLSLPIYPELTNSQLTAVVEAIREYYQ